MRSWDKDRSFIPNAEKYPIADLYACWDSKRLYLADYSEPTHGFYAWDPADAGYATLAAFPDAGGMCDSFCSDRRGHVFTSGWVSSSSHRYGSVTLVPE